MIPKRYFDILDISNRSLTNCHVNKFCNGAGAQWHTGRVAVCRILHIPFRSCDIHDSAILRLYHVTTQVRTIVRSFRITVKSSIRVESERCKV